MSSFTRRNFLTLASSAMAGAAFAPHAAAGTWAGLPENLQSKKIQPDDETYWSLVREQFPIIHNEVDLNTGTMGPSPAIVTQTLQQRIAYTDSTGDYGGQEKEDCRAACGHLLNCSPDEIGLTHNVTEGICIIASGLDLKKGDEVILSTHEHVGNAVPWLARRQRDGIEIRTIVAAKSQQETLKEIEAAITPRTKVIALPHISCTIGQVFPVKEIAALARSKNIFYMVDGAHPPGMMPVDVQEIGCDAYVTCGHKWLCGPKGTGFLFIKKDLIDSITPVWGGGEATGPFDLEKQTIEWLPTAHRYTFATQNNALYFALITAIDFFRRIGLDNVQARTQYMANMLRDKLKQFSSVDILTPDDSRSAITGFYVRGTDYLDIAKHLSQKENMRIRIVPEANLKSIRLSTHVFNAPEDVDLLIKGLKEIIS
jgi:selenocysteine lyase/cysteine desulfurase